MSAILESYSKVRNKPVYRHSIGRISCLSRIPIYIFSAGFQLGKLGIKAISSPFVEVGNWVFNSKKLSSWNFTGVAKDGLIELKLLDKLGKSALGVIFAPTENYIPFILSFVSSFILISGALHDLEADPTCGQTQMNTTELKDKLFGDRIAFSEAITDKTQKPKRLGKSAETYSC